MAVLPMWSFFSRLKQRKLFHWAVAYLAGAWLLLQVLDLLAQPFAWPALVLRAATVLLAVGFLALLVVAWYHGEKGAQKVSGIELLMLAGILALAAAAVAFVGGSRIPSRAISAPTASATEQGSIAVLPFADLSPKGDQQYFTDGLTEELLNVLSQVPELRVVSRTSAFAFQGKRVPLDSIARALKVAHVLEGSVRKDGNRIRITAQLINASSGYHLWSQTYDRDIGDIFAVQDEIARAIVRSMQVQLSEVRSRDRLAKEETRDPQAHALVLEGSQLGRKSFRASLETAVAVLQQAIARDSGYARAHALLAHMYLNQNYGGYGPHEELVAKARSAAQRALALDPTLADAELALARIATDFDWDFRAAEAHYRKAIELNPGSAGAYGGLAWLLAQTGHTDEAIVLAQRETSLDPLDPYAHMGLGVMYYYGGQLEKAVEAHRAALNLRENWSTLINISLSYAFLGRHTEAVVAAERAAALARDEQYSLSNLAYVNARAGRRAEAERYMRALEARPEATPYELAVAYAGLGDRQRTLSFLEKAVAAREPSVADLGVEPIWAEYRNEPRFRALLARLGLHWVGPVYN